MEFIIVAIILLVLIFSYFLIKKIIIGKRIDNLITKLCHKYNYDCEKKDKVCDYLIKTNKQLVKVVIAIVPKNSSVTINSHNTWSLRWGGKRVGRSYPNQRYMNELIPFLKLPQEVGTLKVVVLYPQTEKVQKYLNESEIALVKDKEMVYDYQIVNYSNLEESFEEL